jgi:hypothetical protein
MAGKKSFLLRLDNEKFEALEKWAADEFRSVNGQIEWLIYKSLNDAKRVKKTSSSSDNRNEKQ